MSKIILSDLTLCPFGLLATLSITSPRLLSNLFHQTILLKAAKWEPSFSTLIVIRFVTE